MPQFLISPCCQGRVRKYGSRRFQCVGCLKTWRKQKKKRGRKQLRINRQMVNNYLNKKPVSSRLIIKHKEAVRRRLQLSLDKYLAFTQWEYPPDDTDLIAVADGMYQILETKPYVVYFILLRLINHNQA
ncbi:MAG: hypothetical protein Q8P83_02105 [bacterium]|nr:hypothetical protein [bacterium]